MALRHLNSILNIWLSFPLSWVGVLIPWVLRFPHHGRHCLQLTVGIKLTEMFVATEEKNIRQRERKRFVASYISLEVTQESSSWAWRGGEQRKSRAPPERNGSIQKGEEPATHLQ